MRLVLTPGDGLNAVSCDRLIAHLSESSGRNDSQITIDLLGASFADPYGMACLLLACRAAARRGQKLAMVLPGSERSVQSMVHAGFLDQMRPLAELRNLPREARGGSAAALPISAIRSHHDVQMVVARLMELARDKLGYRTGDVLDSAKVISELCNNIVDHSKSEGVVLAQIRSDRQGTRYVALAVADDGVGVRASLARRYPEAADWRHGEAIERALGGLSSRPTGGGVGLRSVTAVVRRYAGRLTVRSGSDRIYVSSDRQPRTASGALFPGTLVGISFSQRS